MSAVASAELMDGATLETHFSQADWDLICQNLPSSAPVRTVPASTDTWLRLLHDLTADVPTRRPFPLVEDQPVAEDSATESDVTSSSSPLPLSTYTVPQQLLPYVSKYNFETCRSTYFEFSSEPSTTQKGQITPSKYQKGLTCDFPPDYKCKVSPFPVVTTCETFPADSLCGRCGSIGDHTMIHCLGCCQAYHAFCAHLPTSLVHSLTSWYCHRCAECLHCHEKEVFGKKFASDIIETCHRCHSQYHVHCEKINHFLVVCRESSKQTKICQRCFFQSNCRGCKALISAEDILRECIGMNGEACSVCRNTEEKDLCRNCLSLLHDEDLKQIVCDICKDTTHLKCLRDTDLHRLSVCTGRFICCDCQKNVISMKKEERWAEKSALQILDRLRSDVFLYINDTLDKLEVTSTTLPDPESVDSPFTSELDSEQLSSDSGFQSNGDSEGFPSISREPSAVVNILTEVLPTETCLPQRSTSSSVAVQTTSLRSPARFSRPSSNSKDDIAGLVQSLSLTGAVAPDPVFFLEGRVVPLQAEVAPSLAPDLSSVVEELSNLLRELLIIRNEKEVCLWPKNFSQAVEDALSKNDLPAVLLQTLKSHFSDMFRRTILPKEEVFHVKRRKRRSLPVGQIFPVVHRGDETLMLLSGTSEQSSTGEERRRSITADLRLCMYCTVAGDDNVGYGGRILCVGYDLWAHIGCLNYVATKKRYFDYTVINIDSLRKNECASCPVRMGVITCAVNNCKNAYHFNCAVHEKCSLTVANGVVCSVHKHAMDEVTDIRILRINDLEESFTDLPVYVKAPPSNIRSVGNCDWTSGIRKEDVKLHVGGVHVEQLGRLVRGWDTQETLLPCGYKMHRLFWSTKDPRLLTRYTFFTMDMNALLDVKALICSILEREDIPDFEALEKFRSDQEATRKKAEDAPEVELDDLPTFDLVLPVRKTSADRELLATLGSLKETSVQKETPVQLKPALHKPPVARPVSPKPHSPKPASPALPNVVLPQAVEVVPVVDCADPAVEVYLDSEMPAEVPVNEMYDDFDLPEELPPPVSHENDTAVKKTSLDVKQEMLKAQEKELERKSFSPEIYGPPIHHKKPGGPPTPLDVISNIPCKRRRAVTPFRQSPLPSQDSKRTKLSSGKPTSKRDRASQESRHRSDSSASRVESVMTSEVDSAWSESSARSEYVATPERRTLRSSKRFPLTETPTKELKKDVKTKGRKSAVESSPDIVELPNYTKRPSTRSSISRPSLAKKNAPEAKAEIKTVNSNRKTIWADKKGASKNNKTVSMPARMFIQQGSSKQKAGPANEKVKASPKKGANSSVASLKYVPTEKGGTLRSSARLKTTDLPSTVSSPEIAPPKIVFRPSATQKKEEEILVTMSEVTRKMLEEKLPGKTRKQVQFSNKVNESVFVPDFNELPGYATVNGEIQMESGPYCCPTVYDPEPQSFSEVKRRGREEVARRRKRRVMRLLGKLKTVDLSIISKNPSQLCVLVAEDGFLVASHSYEDLVMHLYEQLERNRIAFGLNLPTPFGKTILMEPLEFVALSYNVVRFMLEQLTIPANAFNVYERKYFSKDVLKGRSKGELDSFHMTLFDRGPTCSTCPLPFFCFHLYEGRTYARVPLHERQVVMKWNVPYEPLEQTMISSTMYRIRDTIQVNTSTFPEYYEDIRHSNRQTCTMVYAVHQDHNVVSLALVSKAAFPAGTEIKFDPTRLPRPIEAIIGVSDFSCFQHSRDK